MQSKWEKNKVESTCKLPQFHELLKFPFKKMSMHLTQKFNVGDQPSNLTFSLSFFISIRIFIFLKKNCKALQFIFERNFNTSQICRTNGACRTHSGWPRGAAGPLSSFPPRRWGPGSAPPRPPSPCGGEHRKEGALWHVILRNILAMGCLVCIHFYIHSQIFYTVKFALFS